MDHLSLHLKSFNEKIKVMNQTNSKSLTLSAIEARNLHNDIFVLLAQIAELSQPIEPSDNTVTINVDGGHF